MQKMSIIILLFLLSGTAFATDITYAFSGGPHAALAKTYVVFDLDPDGSFIHTEQGYKVNLGHSAQIGASMSRPPADPHLIARIPDNKPHRLGIFSLDSQGYFLPDNPVATFYVGMSALDAPSNLRISITR